MRGAVGRNLGVGRRRVDRREDNMGHVVSWVKTLSYFP